MEKEHTEGEYMEGAHLEREYIERELMEGIHEADTRAIIAKKGHGA